VYAENLLREAPTCRRTAARWGYEIAPAWYRFRYEYAYTVWWKLARSSCRSRSVAEATSSNMFVASVHLLSLFHHPRLWQNGFATRICGLQVGGRGNGPCILKIRHTWWDVLVFLGGQRISGLTAVRYEAGFCNWVSRCKHFV
jgi:hypothetical protein